MVSDTVYALCHAQHTVSSELARDLSLAPGKVAAKLYSKTAVKEVVKDASSDDDKSSDGEPLDGESLDRAAECGQFGSRPSDLFLKIYNDVLDTLEADPLAGLVSPPLLGASGVMPLSIISVIPDIIRHMADVIVHAQTEVFLATNYWEASTAAATTCDALRELSKRAGERGGPKVVVKLMYDRGNPMQVIENHQIVPVKTYTGDAVKLPAPSEIPHIDLEVMNYHRPPLGTFHAKYMVVDRRIALLNSNNIQDRVNVEMMTHIEGPIVHSFYDMALLSWHGALTPPLPLLSNCPPPQTDFDFGDENKYVKMKDLGRAKEDARAFLKEHQEYAQEDRAPDGTPIAHAHKTNEDQDQSDDHKSSDPDTSAPTQTTSLQAPALSGDNAADANISSEAAAVERSLEPNEHSSGDTNGNVPVSKSGRMAAVTKHLNTTLQPDTTGDEPDLDDAEEFRPHIIHSKHPLVPMALVNRPPRGSAGHSGTKNPQDVAWLAAFKYAKHKIFIQTPTFNASPVVDAALEAVRRGVQVILYLDLGFNDAGEMLPFQGGTNEQVVVKMYKALKEEEKKNLQVFWYTGKDQSRPINASAKKRNCHVKIMTIDDAVGIQGNGNQDAQSWFHSQEINVMLDSPSIVAEWHAGIRANQNTHLHGQVGLDGIWRDAEGKELVDATGGKKSIFGPLQGVVGAVQRVRGEGGF